MQRIDLVLRIRDFALPARLVLLALNLSGNRSHLGCRRLFRALHPLDWICLECEGRGLYEWAILEPVLET